MLDTKSSEPGELMSSDLFSKRAQPRNRSVRREVRLGSERRPSDAYRRVLDSLQEHVAVLDHTGTILTVNKPWREFARKNGDPLLRRTGVGVNYLSICRAAKGDDATLARRAAAGILSVMRGKRRGFSLEYPCHSPRQRRWFLMYASRVALPGPGAVVSHVDITLRREAEDKLRDARDHLEAEVQRRTRKLAQTNATLEREIVHRLQAERRLRENERALREALNEQERISQDLHDSVLQALYAIGLGLQASEPLVAGTSEEVAGTLRGAVQQLNFVIREVRGYIAGIESTLLQRGDVIEGIQALVELLGRQSRMQFRVSLSRAAVRSLSRDQARHVLQIASEALGNVIRHSHAQRVWVQLRRHKDHLRLEVRDDGVGLERRGSHRGRGLRNIARRARTLPGRLVVESGQPKGTRVCLELPLPSPRPSQRQSQGEAGLRRRTGREE